MDSSQVNSPSPIPLPKVWLYEVGKGRVVVIEASSLDTFTKGSYDAVTCGLGAWNAAGKWVPGWEYGLGLFGKAIVWAGKKESGINIVEVKADGKSVSLNINNENQKNISCNCQIAIKNSFYEEESSFTEKINLVPGGNQIEMKVKGDLTDKMHIVEVFLKDEKGQSLGWVGGKFDIKKPVSVSVKMDKESAGYREGEKPVAIVSIKKEIPDPMNLSLEAEIKDRDGGIVWKNSMTVEVNESTKEIKIPVENMRQVNKYHELDIELKQTNKTLSKDKLALFIFPEKMPIYSDFYIGCWGNLEPHPLKFQISAKTLK